MKRVIAYLILVSCLYLTGFRWLLLHGAENCEDFRVALTCATIGGLGGCLYCLRAVYLNAAVNNSWDPKWHVWYYLRPLVSGGSGAVSYLFLKAGLLVLESGTKAGASEIGFYALAFIAGFNVDKFIRKIEDVSEAVWGIEKSRAAKKSDEDKQK
jgi:hypothetical protein